MPIANKFDEHL